MDVVIIVLAAIIVTVAWAVFWALRLWRKWRELWAAVTDLFAVLGELQTQVDSIGSQSQAALTPSSGGVARR